MCFLAIIFTSLWDKGYGKLLSVAISVLIIFINLTAILSWYGGLKYQDQKERFGRKASVTTLVQNDYITYKNMEMAATWIKEESEKSTGKACFNSPSTYLASYKHIFNNNYPNYESKRINGVFEMDQPDDCDVFLIDHSGNSQNKIADKFENKGINIKLGDSRSFGLITVWEVIK
jgi:hypothetical protein